MAPLQFLDPEPFDTPAAHGRIWTTPCGQYRIRESYLTGTDTPRYYAQTLVDGVWEIAGKHRRCSAAIKRVEKEARRKRRQEMRRVNRS